MNSTERLLGFCFGAFFGGSFAQCIMTDNTAAGILAAVILAVFVVIGAIAYEKTDIDQA